MIAVTAVVTIVCLMLLVRRTMRVARGGPRVERDRTDRLIVPVLAVDAVLLTWRLVEVAF